LLSTRQQQIRARIAHIASMGLPPCRWTHGALIRSPARFTENHAMLLNRNVITFLILALCAFCAPFVLLLLVAYIDSKISAREAALSPPERKQRDMKRLRHFGLLLGTVRLLVSAVAVFLPAWLVSLYCDQQCENAFNSMLHWIPGGIGMLLIIAFEMVWLGLGALVWGLPFWYRYLAALKRP
jgi:hypothetical protein